jgi:predicted phosphate transport protein (TIGR00153 family)
MNSIFNFFSPKDKLFQPLFEQAGKNLVKISEALVDAVNAPNQTKRKEHIKEIEKLEQAGDDIAHAIFLGLGKTFITPFDREDIHALVNALDDIADYIYAAGINLDLYNIKTINKAMISLAELLLEMCTDLNNAIKELRTFKNTDLIAEVCLRINDGESRADYICNTEVASLFDNEQDAIELIKQKEVLQMLEMASDKCDDAANVLEAILIKNA